MIDLENYIRRYVSISAVIDTLRRKQLALLDPRNWDDRNDRYFMSLYQEKKSVKAIYALCAAQCSETYQHWRLFTGGADGACLEIERQPLEDSLRENSNIRFGSVHYLRLNQVESLKSSDLECLPFSKRQGFTAEKEYRIVACSGDPQANAMNIEIELKWIGKVYLNPWMPEPLVHSVKQTLKSIPGCAGLKVQRSLLINSQRWKAAGDKVVGKQPTKALAKTSKKVSA